MIRPSRLAVVIVAALASACAGKRTPLPTGPATAFPGFAEAYEQATADCRDVKSITASLGLSGRAGSTRLGGRIDAGLAFPSGIRLELFPPLSFGKPAIILAARDDNATLLLPRDNRVLRGARPDEIVEALAGVPLTAAELRSVLSGCGLALTAPGEGRAYQKGWIAADAGGTTVYLRQMDGRWRVAGATRGPVTVQYYGTDGESGRPKTINMRTTPSPGTPATDLTVKVSQVEVNVPLADEVFHVDVPQGAAPLTLEELKRGAGRTEAKTQ